MTTLMREPGTYRTKSGALVHSRAIADGRIVLEREDGRRMGGDEDLVKLSDDPDWPDLHHRDTDLQLFD
ncbi:MAG TPA: hypothetical protein VFV20_09785 [Candidatus Limnocylindria bacterium]|nr:hypothetical protein [Candidatus Limnocylindria bacterium]